MDEEKWLPVVGYEDGYMVSSLGRVKSIDRIVSYTDGRNAIKLGRILANGKLKSKYLTVALYENGKRKYIAVQNIVLNAFVGPKPNGLFRLHADDNPENNKLTNLRYGSAKDNADDRKRNGNWHVGQSSAGSKLKDFEVREIKRRLKQNESHRSIAAFYNISTSVISSIKSKRTWKHLP